jgi:hypothetical protein
MLLSNALYTAYRYGGVYHAHTNKLKRIAWHAKQGHGAVEGRPYPPRRFTVRGELTSYMPCTFRREALRREDVINETASPHDFDFHVALLDDEKTALDMEGMLKTKLAGGRPVRRLRRVPRARGLGAGAVTATYPKRRVGDDYVVYMLLKVKGA